MVLGVYAADECQHMAGELQVALEACADEAASLRRANEAPNRRAEATEARQARPRALAARAPRPDQSRTATTRKPM